MSDAEREQLVDEVFALVERWDTDPTVDFQWTMVQLHILARRHRALTHRYPDTEAVA